MEMTAYDFNIDLVNDRAWYISPEGIVLNGQSHSSILRKKFQPDLEKMTKGGLESWEAESSLERRLIQFGHVSIGSMGNRFYSVVYQLDNTAKYILQGFCKSIKTDKTSEVYIQLQLDNKNLKFTVNEIAGGVLL